MRSCRPRRGGRCGFSFATMRSCSARGPWGPQRARCVPVGVGHLPGSGSKRVEVPAGQAAGATSTTCSEWTASDIMRREKLTAADGGARQTQDAGTGVKVTGVGEVTVKPDTVVIRGEFSASADTAADALAKYRDGRRRALKMMESLGLESLTVTGNGPIITVAPVMNERNAMRAAMMGFDQGQPEPDGGARCARCCRSASRSCPTRSRPLTSSRRSSTKRRRPASGSGARNRSRSTTGRPSDGARRKPRSPPWRSPMKSPTARSSRKPRAPRRWTMRASAREMLARLAGRKAGRVIAIRHEGPVAEKSAFDGTFRVTLHVVFELEK